MSRPVISVVVPVYMSVDSLSELVRRIDLTLSESVSSFELILVEDGSPDESWSMIEALASQNRFVRGVRLSRNFGQHPAIAAGLEVSRGEWIVVMDCDLQDQPEEIPKLLAKAKEGFDQVVAVRENRQDSNWKRLSSVLYVRILSYLSGRTINPAVGNFGIYHRRVIDAITSLGEQGRTFGLLALWVGFRRTEVPVVHVARPYGRTSYSFRKLLRMGLSGILAYSDKPLRLTVKAGGLMSLTSVLAGVTLALRHFLFGPVQVGWTSVVVSVMFLSGIILGSVGIVGLYVGQIYEESKKRPVYIERDRTPET